MKKFFSLVLALVMALSLTTIAWGAVDYEYNTGVPGKALAVTTNGVYDGNNATLQDVALTGSYDAGVVLTGTDAQSVQNVKIVGVTRGIESGFAVDADTIMIDNVVVEDCVRAIHINTVDQADLYVSNSTFEGKISFDIHGGFAIFTNCTFKYDAALVAKGNMVESYDNVVFENCAFEEGFEVSFENFAADDALTMINCTYAGNSLTAENMDDLFTNTAGVDVDGVVYVYNAADGASKSTSGVYAKGTYEGAAAVDVTVYYFKAVDNKVNKDGTWKADGNVEYYTLSCDAMQYAKVNTVGEADMVIYTDAACKNAYMYLAAIDPVYYGDGVVTKNFGTGCTQYTNDEDAGFDDKATYYTAFNALYVGVEAGAAYDVQLMVAGKLVPVVASDLTVNGHKPVYTFDKKNNVESIKCSVCNAVAVKAGNYASVPAASLADVVYTDGTAYWYWAGVSAPATSDKVESAQTFDAGIAMYVGMSVMAAAGSAVVIGKKKD